MQNPKNQKILLVDDEPALREILTFVLTEEGFQVRSAPNAQEALILLERHKFDLIVTDVRMPGINGFQFVRKATAESKCPAIIMMTGFIDVNFPEAFDCGATEIIGKPINHKQLAVIIHKTLENPVINWTQIEKQVLEIKHLVFEKNASRISFNPVQNSTEVQMGRGGFFIPFAQGLPKVDSMIVLNIHSEEEVPFDPGKHDFKFIGKVRWARSKPENKREAGFGIEIKHLDNQDTAKRYLEFIAKHNVTSFIPLGEAC